MDTYKSKIMLLFGLMIFSTISISFSGCIGEDCSNCANCTDCYIGINSTQEAQLFDELDGVVKDYIAQKENIMDKSLIQTTIKFKSKNEAFVSVLVNNKTWNGTWLYSDNQWKPGSDFKQS